MKKLLLTIFAVLLTLCMALCAACSCGGSVDDDTDNPGGTTNPGGNTDDGDNYIKEENGWLDTSAGETIGNKEEEKVEASLTLGAEAINAVVGEQKTIVASYTKIDGCVLGYQTSDATVATVDSNGNVTAMKPGTATITVTYGEKSATCAVNVSLGGVQPSIAFDFDTENISVGMSQTFNFKGYISFNGERYDDATFTYVIDNAEAGSIDEDGIFTPSAADKTATVTVTAEWRGIQGQLVKTFNLTTKAAKYVLVNDGQTNLVELYTVANHGGTTYATSSPFVVKAYDGDVSADKEISEVSIAVTENDGVVEWNETTKTITALKAGEATFKVTVGSGDDAFERLYTVKVKKPLADYTATVGKFSTLYGYTANGSLAEVTGMGGAIVEAYQNGRALSVIDGNVFGVNFIDPYDVNTVGDVTVYNETVGYTLKNLQVYYAVITNAEELLTFMRTDIPEDAITINGYNAPTVEAPVIYGGYTIVDADIDMSGKTIDTRFAYEYNNSATTTKTQYFSKGNMAFKGTFDGQGHVINGLAFTNDSQYGIIGLIYNGIVKNVGLTNVSLTSLTSSQYYVAALCGGIAGNYTVCAAEITNVYVQVSSASDDKGGANGCSIIAGGSYNYAFKIHDCVFEYPTVTVLPTYVGGPLFAGNRFGFPNMSNVYLVTGTEFVTHHWGWTSKPEDVENMYMMLAKRDTDKYTEYGTKIYNSSTGQLRRVVLDPEADAYKSFVTTVTNFDAYYSYRHLSESTNSESFTNFDTRYWKVSNGIAVFNGVTVTGNTEIREGIEITVEPTDSVVLHLDTPNVTDSITWSSDNEAIAKIGNDGKVEILTTGDVTFRATVGSDYKEILVHVKFAETPVINVDAVVGGIVSVVNGESCDLLPYVTYNGNTYNGLTYTYAWENASLELGSIDDGVFNSNGTKGKDRLTVTTTWYGNTFTLSFDVSVSSEYVFTLNGENGTAFIFDEIALDTVAEHEGTAYVNQRDFVLVTTIGGQEVNPSFTYSANSIVSIENGKITALNAGEVVVKITIYDDGVEISKYVTVKVRKPVYEITEAIDMYSAHDGGYYNGTDFTTLKQWFEQSGKNFVANYAVQTIGGEVTSLTVDEGNVYGLTIKDNTATFTVYDDKVGYTVTIKGYDRIIVDVEDFVEFFGAPSQEWLYQYATGAKNTADVMTFAYPRQIITGSYALAEDIDMQGISLPLSVSINGAYDKEHGGKFAAFGLTGTYTWVTEYRWFTAATFDGLGHTVTNLHLDSGSNGGLFGKVGAYDVSTATDGVLTGLYSGYNIDASNGGFNRSNVGSIAELPGGVATRIKNIAFANVTYGSKGNETLLANQYSYYAGLENVYVQISGEVHDRQSAIGLAFNVGVFKNVVVEFPEGPEIVMGDSMYGYGPMVRDGSNAIYFVQGNKDKCCIENFVFITKTPSLGGYYKGNRVYVASNETNKDITDNGAGSEFVGKGYDYTGTNEAIKSATNKLYVPGTYRYDDYAAMIKAVEDGELSLDKFTTDNTYWAIYQNKLVWAGRVDAEKELLASSAYLTIDGAKVNETEIFKKEEGIAVKDTATIAVVCERANATDVTFASDNTQIATVDANGAVSAVAVGKAAITVTFKVDGIEKSLSVNVTVSEFRTAVLQSLKTYVNDVETDEIVLDELGGEVTDNNTAVVKVVSDKYAEHVLNGTFTSSDTSVVTCSAVDGGVLVTAHAESTTPVTITYSFTVSGEPCSATFTVTVNAAYTVKEELDYSCMHGFSADYITDELGGDVVSVVDKTSGTEYWVNGKCALTNDTDGLLQKTVIVRTDTKVNGICVYEIPLNVYSGIISTAEDFLNFARVSYKVEVIQHAQYTEDGKTVSVDSEPIYLTVSGYGDEAGSIKGYANEFKLKEYMSKTDFARLSDTFKVTTCTLGGGNTGYYILTDDIDLTGTTLGHYSGNAYVYINNKGDISDDSGFLLSHSVNCRSTDMIKFNGIFDGQGHTVKNLTINRDFGGLFGNLTGATVKNVGFSNVNITINSTGYAMAYGVIANNMDAKSTIENVYLDLNSWGTSDNTAGNRMFALLTVYQYGHLKNVIVETPELDTMPKLYGNGAIGFGQKPAASAANASAENVVVISKNKWIANYQTARLTVAENDADITTVGGIDVTSFAEFYVLNGINRYDDVYTFAQSDYDMTGFDNECWDISTGVAVWKGLFAEVGNWRDNANASTVLTVDGKAMPEDGVSIKQDGSVTVKLTNDTVVTDFSATVSDASYITVTVNANELSAKLSGKKGTLNPVTCRISYKIGGKAYSKQFSVSVANILNTANYSVETGLLDNDTTNVWETDGYAIKSVVAKSDVATELYDSESGKISLTNTAKTLITKTLIVTVGKNGANDIVYEIPVNVYTKFIESAEEFIDVFAKPEYYMTLTQQYQATDGTIRTVKRDSRTDGMVVNENAKDWSIFIDDTKEGETRLGDKDIVLTQKSIEGAFLLACDIDLSLYNNYSSKEINGVKYVTQISPVMNRYGYGNLKWQAYYSDNTYKGQNFYGYAGTHTFYFDGDGHTISNFNETVQKFTLDENGAVTKVAYGICDRGGLFGSLTDSTVKNLSVTSASMTGYQINVGSTLVLDDDNKLTVTLGSGDAVDTSSVTNQTIMAYNVKNTVFENLYVEVDNPAYNRNGGMFYTGYDVTLKDVVIKSGSVDKHNEGYGYGPISICEYNETITYDNVVVISEYKPLGYYNKGRLWLAENDKDVTKVTIGDVEFTDKLIVKQGVNRYDDFVEAVDAGKTTIGDMTITPDGVTRKG